jgi:ubiquinone/menaquinone biosynthesis C-methylase UbiE
MRVQDGTLNEVVEIPVLVSLMPELAGIAAADLGCGTGAMCRRLFEQGAASVTGFDASERMLSRARAQSPGTQNLHYVQADLEVLHLPPNSLDLILSSLALHYVVDFTAVAQRVTAALKPGGCFIFSVEHPVVTCNRREWLLGKDGTRSSWPVDHYLAGWVPKLSPGTTGRSPVT